MCSCFLLCSCKTHAIRGTACQRQRCMWCVTCTRRELSVVFRSTNSLRSPQPRSCLQHIVNERQQSQKYFMISFCICEQFCSSFIQRRQRKENERFLKCEKAFVRTSISVTASELFSFPDSVKAEETRLRGIRSHFSLKQLHHLHISLKIQSRHAIKTSRSNRGIDPRVGIPCGCGSGPAEGREDREDRVRHLIAPFRIRFESLARSRYAHREGNTRHPRCSPGAARSPGAAQAAAASSDRLSYSG